MYDNNERHIIPISVCLGALLRDLHQRNNTWNILDRE